MADYDQIKKEVLADLDSLLVAVKEFKWTRGDVAKVLPPLIIAVERVGGMKGPDKKRLVIDILNKLIDIPFVPEALEDNLIAMMVGPAIDWIVAAFNHVFGKVWTGLFEKVG